MRDHFGIEALCNIVERQHKLPDGDWSDVAIREYTDIDDGIRVLHPEDNFEDIQDKWRDAMSYRYDMAKKLKNKRLSTVLRILLMNDKDVDTETLKLVIKYIR